MSEQTPLLKGEPGAPAPSAPPAYTQAPPAQAPPAVQPTVIVVPPQQVIVTGVNFSDVPARLTCPNCRNEILTRMEYTPGSLTWLIIIVLLFFGFWGGCCLIPLCIDGVKDVNHICPTCNYQVGTFKRM